MKKLICFAICGTTFVNAQSQSRWHAGMESNFDFYKPYTIEAQHSDKKVHSYTASAFFQGTILANRASNWSTGLAVKTVSYKAEKIRTIEDLDQYYLVDLRSLSLSLGIRNEYSRTLFWTDRRMGSLGLQSTLFFLELYECKLYDQQGEFHRGYGLSDTRDLGLYPSFPLSSVNLSLFYRMMFNLQKKHPIGFTASLGTNLYSDWDQFSRYAWVGLGVDIGFGKKLVAPKEEKQQ